jgi:predicted TIM-barrel fold metal-dependent hydrolase
MEVVDHHAHLLARAGHEPGLVRVLTESADPAQIEQVVEHPAFHKALVDLAGLLGTEPTPKGLAEARERDGFEAFTRRLLSACGFREVLVDDGFRFPGAMELDEFRTLVGCPVGRILRIESEAEAAARGWPPFDELVECFRAGVATAVAAGARALKTVAAYRCGLALEPSGGAGAARSAYDRWRRSGSPRLVERDLISFFVLHALEATAARRLPLQVHTGFGDRDLVLHLADPSLLRPLLEHPSCAQVPVVLLHCHPFVPQASYLAGIYPDVFLDVSLAMTHVAHRGAALLLDALGLAPATKLLFATDASQLPEAFLLATLWWKDGLARALGHLVDEGFVTDKTALRWAAMVLSENARRIYG